MTPRVAVVIIGAEVLSGKVEDQNGPFLVTQLRSLGSKLIELRVIDDEIEVISKSVKELSQHADYVITTGGIGPTHDDLTIAGVAHAYGVPVIRDGSLESSLREYYGERINEAHLRMADIPSGALIHPGSVPTIQMKNTFVLPGVPTLMRACFERVQECFRSDAIITKILFLSEPESSIADALSRAVKDHPSVKMGSYPRFDQGPARVKVTVEGTDRNAVDRAIAQLNRTLPKGSVLQEREESHL